MPDLIRKLIKLIWKDVMGGFRFSILYSRFERYRDEREKNICRADTGIRVG